MGPARIYDAGRKAKNVEENLADEAKVAEAGQPATKKSDVPRAGVGPLNSHAPYKIEGSNDPSTGQIVSSYPQFDDSIGVD
jgi:hypothetical protein